MKVQTFQYTAIADEARRIYTSNDGEEQYGSSDILDPDSVSQVNVFINGILQPSIHYNITPGVLHLLTIDLPPSGTPIILQFLIIHE